MFYIYTSFYKGAFAVSFEYTTNNLHIDLQPRASLNKYTDLKTKRNNI